jgi:hypothetical protein
MMNHKFAKKILFALIATSFSSIVLADDDLLALESAYVPNVDVPDNQGTAGFLVEGWWVRAYNNDLGFTPITTGELKTVSQNFDFAGRLGVEYVGPNSFNITKFDYEHFPESRGQELAYIGSDIFLGEVESDYRGVSAIAEQPLLIGPYWDARFFGGLRFVQLDQMFQAYNLTDLLTAVAPTFGIGKKFEARFDGVGTIAGFRSTFKAYGFGLGVSSYVALLIGHSKINGFFLGVDPREPGLLQYAPIDIDEDYAFVPELHVRGFLNYTYHFASDTNLTVEAGWRGNQFFNFRSRVAFEDTIPSFPFTPDEQLGFAGPYLQVHVDTRI